MSYILRSAYDTDHKEIVRIIYEEYADQYSVDLIDETFKHNFTGNDSFINKLYICVASEGDKVLGYALAREHILTGVFELECVIQKRSRGRGIGRGLLEFVISESSESGCREYVAKVDSHNMRCINMLDSLDFVMDDGPVSEKPFYVRMTLSVGSRPR